MFIGWFDSFNKYVCQSISIESMFPQCSPQLRSMFLISHCCVQSEPSAWFVIRFVFIVRMILWEWTITQIWFIQLNICANRFVLSPCFLHAPLSLGRCSWFCIAAFNLSLMLYVLYLWYRLCSSYVHRMIWFIQLNICANRFNSIELWSVIDLFDSWCDDIDRIRHDGCEIILMRLIR